MAYLKNWTDNFLQIFLMGTSWVAVSINNITRASREMTSRKNINIFEFNGVNVAKHWHVAGEVFVHFKGTMRDDITSAVHCSDIMAHGVYISIAI